MRSIGMQYPFDATGANELFDGQIHQIVPEFVYPMKLNGRVFAVMSYFDQTADTRAFALLVRVNGQFYKVPLDDYNVLLDFMNLHLSRLKKVDANLVSFNDEIHLAESLCASELLSPQNYVKEQKPLNINQYVPVNSNGITDVRGNIFSSLCVIFKQNNDEEYIFSKDFSFPLRDEKIQYGSMHYQVSEDSIKYYDFEIDVPEGTYAEKMIIDKNGEQRVIRVLVIPGLHKYHVTYSDFFRPEDYSSARESEEIIVKARYPEFYLLRDTARAFVQGGATILDMDFVKQKTKDVQTLTLNW